MWYVLTIICWTQRTQFHLENIREPNSYSENYSTVYSTEYGFFLFYSEYSTEYGSFVAIRIGD